MNSWQGSVSDGACQLRLFMTQAERGADVRFPPPLVYLISTLVGVAVHYGVARAPVPLDWSAQPAAY